MEVQRPLGGVREQFFPEDVRVVDANDVVDLVVQDSVLVLGRYYRVAEIRRHLTHGPRPPRIVAFGVRDDRTDLGLVVFVQEFQTGFAQRMTAEVPNRDHFAFT
ncbi:hypothetical protein [Halorussus aquaticus]|uniref:hypothetical protein n=1 Tax=Halorussus aquaticus TaxID=2953748 RepID=UPI0036124FFB